MATKSDGGTTGPAAPWTAQQFAAWKRGEKGRLVRLRTALSKGSLASSSYAYLERQIDVTKTEVRTLTSSIADLKEKAKRPAIPVFRDREKSLEQRIGQLNDEISSRIFTGGYRDEKEEVASRLREMRGQHRAATDRVAYQAKKELPAQKLLLKEVQQRLPSLVKFRNAAKDLGLANSRGPLGDAIDKQLAELDKGVLPPWAVEAMTAYAKERKAEARKALKNAADNRKQLDTNSKELADLQRSESATLKRIESLERRLAREQERVLAERKFIYTKLSNKRSSDGQGFHSPLFTQRERSFLNPSQLQRDDGTIYHSWAHDSKHKDWATRGVEFSAKLRTSARKIEELAADIKELKAVPKRIQALKSSIRKFEKDIATADKANAAAGGWPKGKAPRIGYIANAHAFEKYMAEWMRWLGWEDAKAKPVGPDEGIDVKATGALGQAKHWDTEVGIEEVQRHNGVCEGIQKYGRVFLSKSGYTPQAIKWANDRDLPLFEMKAGSKDAGVVASTKAGEKLLKVGAKAMKGNKRN